MIDVLCVNVFDIKFRMIEIKTYEDIADEKVKGQGMCLVKMGDEILNKFSGRAINGVKRDGFRTANLTKAQARNVNVQEG